MQCGRLSRGALQRCVFGGTNWKADGKTGATAVPIFRGKFTTVRFHETTRNRKSQTQPTGLAAIAPIKFFKYLLPQFSRQAGTAITYGNKQSSGGVIGIYFHRQPRWRISSGVGEELRNRLLD